MSSENLKTPEDAMGKLCPFGVGATASNTPAKCVATACMAWLWGWQDGDGFEEKEVSQAHWSELVQTEPAALPMILAQRIGPEHAKHYGERWAKLWSSSPKDFLSNEGEEFDPDSSIIDRVEAEAEAIEDEGFEEDELAGRDKLGAEPLPYHQAVLAFRDAVTELVEEINSAIELSITPEVIENYVANNRPEGIEWGVKESGVSNGIIYATYQRPQRRRGGCGRVAVRA